ncbi:MAG TPA: septum formation initiator family protein [Actinobacteria bacterium]|nr:septum formation initiator family protein [Actinomycetota bacterium]
MSVTTRPGTGARRQGLWRLVLLLVMLLIAACYISPIRAYIERSNQIESERMATEELRRQQDGLLTEKERLKQNDYVEQVARRELGLVRPGEQPFVVKDLNRNNSQAKAAEVVKPPPVEKAAATEAVPDNLVTRLLP